MPSWVLMQHITLRNTRGYYYLQLWQGITGVMVRASSASPVSWLNASSGIPVAWMLSSNGTQATIKFFLDFVKTQSPNVSPSIFMTDRDQAQVNAIHEAFPSSRVLYCRWHVLRAIWTHFVVTEFKDLWDLIQKWVRTPDQYEFDSMWEDIQSDKSIPKSVVQYLAQEWMTCKEMWSAVHCQNRTIFEEGNTNMLLEVYVIILLSQQQISNNLYSYHHVIKSKWLESKRNHQIDYLINTLVEEFLPEVKHCIKWLRILRPEKELAARRRHDILSCAPEIPSNRITQVLDMCYVTVGMFTRLGLSSSVRKLEKSVVRVWSASTKFKVNLERFLW
jgi:hypothetical protein